MDAEKAREIVLSKLSVDPPYGAKITIDSFSTGNGFA